MSDVALAMEPKHLSFKRMEELCDETEAAYHKAVEALPEWYEYQEAIRLKNPHVKEYARKFHCAVAHLPEWWEYEEAFVRISAASIRENLEESQSLLIDSRDNK
jgi:hypothetical protein